MKIVVIDRILTDLLTKISKFENRLIKLRKLEDGFKNRCNKCSICKVEESIFNVAKLIIKPLLHGHNSLVVYLIVEDFKHIYYTLVIDYIRSLYSLIIVLLKPFEQNINIINHELIDLTILPLYNWSNLLDGRNIIKVIKDEDIRLDYNSDDIDPLNYGDDDSEKPFYIRYIGCHEKNSGTATHSNYIEEDSVTSLELPSEHNSMSSEHNSMPSNIPSSLMYNDIDCLSDGTFHQGNLYIQCFERVMCCGTFDYLHFGHKLLLLTAYISTGKVLEIGITASDDILNTKQYRQYIQPLELRRKNILKYLKLLTAVYKNELVRNFDEPILLTLNYYICDFFKGIYSDHLMDSNVMTSDGSRGIDGSLCAKETVNHPISLISSPVRCEYKMISHASQSRGLDNDKELHHASSNTTSSIQSQPSHHDSALLSRKPSISHSRSIDELTDFLANNYKNIASNVPLPAFNLGYSMASGTNDAINYEKCVSLQVHNITSDPIHGNLVLDTLSTVDVNHDTIDDNKQRLHEDDIENTKDLYITLFKLMDILGPSRYMSECRTMVITLESVSGADSVNQYRRDIMYKEWNSVIVGFVYYPEMLPNDNIYPKLSSTFIRLIKNLNKLNS